MRKPIIAGNWKMNKTPAEAKQLVTELIPLVKDAEVRRGRVHARRVLRRRGPRDRKGTNVEAGRSERATLRRRAPSPASCPPTCSRPSGVEYVIIGHSERRQYFGETDKTVNKRTLARCQGRPEGHRLRGRDEGRARSRLHRHDRYLSDPDGAARPDRARRSRTWSSPMSPCGPSAPA